MLVKNNVKKGHKVPENFDLNELNEHLTVEIPLSARVYPSCRHAIAILIVVMYVDNNGLRTNAKELVQWFDDSLKAHDSPNHKTKLKWCSKEISSGLLTTSLMVLYLRIRNQPLTDCLKSTASPIAIL